MINMIVAISKNGVIGRGSDLPWGRSLPEDLKSFKTLTMGSTLYVGKKTAANLPPLKGREVKTLNREGYPSLDTIKTHHFYGGGNPEAWIIGGAEIYNAALKMGVVDKIYLSIVDREFNGDTFFSIEQFKEPGWKLVNERIIRESDPVVKLQEWIRVGI
jgi:dihydrofolate reductase